jgi:hypothetical protein
MSQKRIGYSIIAVWTHREILRSFVDANNYQNEADAIGHTEKVTSVWIPLLIQHANFHLFASFTFQQKSA